MFDGWSSFFTFSPCIRFGDGSMAQSDNKGVFLTMHLGEKRFSAENAFAEALEIVLVPSLPGIRPVGGHRRTLDVFFEFHNFNCASLGLG